MVVQQLRLHIPKHRMFGSTHGLRTKITHALEQLRVDTAKKKKRKKERKKEKKMLMPT